MRSKILRESEEEQTEEISIKEQLQYVLDDLLSLQDSQRIQHWNITGSTFGSLHQIYGDLYALLNDTADVVAERLRYYGHKVSVVREDVLEPQQGGSNYVLFIMRRIDEFVVSFDWFYQNATELDKDLILGLHKELAKISYLISSHQ